MSWGAVLPGDGGLAGLFHEALQTHFSGAQQFGIAALDERGQQHEEGAIVTDCLKHMAHHRIGGVHQEGPLALRIIEAELEMLGVVKEPWGWNAECFGKGSHDSDGGIRLSGLDGFYGRDADAGLFCEGGDGHAAREAPGLNSGSDRHGAHFTQVTPNLAINDESEGLSCCA